MNEQRQSIVSVRGLTAGYGEEIILDNISLDVYPGEVFVILGGSGCGKSTLLKQMIGLYHPLAGQIVIDGRTLTESADQARREIMCSIGVSYQSGALFGSMTLLENVRLPLEEFTDLPYEAMNLTARMKLERVGLGPYLQHMPSEVSGGMQKRAAIARAMALDPKVLFLDEPSAGLDPITSAELDRLIVQLSRSLGITFVIVTHELASIFAIADRVIMLDKQRKTIVATGQPEDLRDNSEDPWVRAFFRRESTDENRE